MKFYSKFKIRIVYDSGYTHDFWVWKYAVKTGANGITHTWQSCSDKNKPVDIASKIEKIESVWQIGHKKVFRFTDPVKG